MKRDAALDCGPAVPPDDVERTAAAMPDTAGIRRWLTAGMSALLLLCLLAWLALGAPLADRPFTLHMSRHMLLVTIIAPLVILLWQRCASGPPVISPLLATVVEFLVVWGWHLPLAHAAARSSLPGFLAEQASFLLAGLILWAAVLQAGAALAGAGGLLLTSMHMTLLGALIVLSPDLHLRYAVDGMAAAMHGAGQGADALFDHRLGGLVMLGVGTPVYLIGGLILVYRQLCENEPDEEAWVTGSRS